MKTERVGKTGGDSDRHRRRVRDSRRRERQKEKEMMKREIQAC